MKTLLLIFSLIFSLPFYCQLNLNPQKSEYRPLDVLTVSTLSKGLIILQDAKGEIYFQQEGYPNVPLEIKISGALGTHIISIIDRKGKLVDRKFLQVNCQTSVEDEDSTWFRFHQKLYWNINKSERINGEAQYVRYEDKTYYFLSCWIRDNVHILTGKKYYVDHLKDAIDLYANNQADDGMIYDFFMDYDGPGCENRFNDHKFIRVSLKDNMFFQRVPVENDVEFLFVYGIYQTWKATGDNQWMRNILINADKALSYNLTSEYCWSKKYNLIKRALCIDTWDFMPVDQASLVGGDVMEVIPGKTKFGIFHGDNTGFASSCQYLSQMYDFVGNNKRAAYWIDISKKIYEQLNKVSWNGNFFTHWVAEDETFKGDYGVDMN